MTEITILRANGGKFLAKKYSLGADGTVVATSYQQAYQFIWQRQSFRTLRSFEVILKKLSSVPDACIIRGAPKEGLGKVVTRTKENFPEPDEGRAWVMLDIDGVNPPDGMLPWSREAVDFVTTLLPAEFREVSYVAVLSNSAGILTREGVPLKSGVRVHLFYLLDRPIPGPLLAAWLELECYRSGFYTVGLNKGDVPMVTPDIDMATIRSSNQIHYTAQPSIGEGVSCVVSPEERVWLVQKGTDLVNVPELEGTILHEARQERENIRRRWAVENGFRRETRRVRIHGKTYSAECLVPENPAADRTGRRLIGTELRGNDNVLGLQLADEKTPNSWYVLKRTPWLARRMGDDVEISLEEFCPAALEKVRELGWIHDIDDGQSGDSLERDGTAPELGWVDGITAAPAERGLDRAQISGDRVSTLSEPASAMEPGLAEARINQMVKLANRTFGLYASEGKLGVIRTDDAKNKYFVGYFGLMYVYAHARTLGDSDWTFVVHALNYRNEWKELLIPSEMLFDGNELLRLLGREGVYADPGERDKLVMYLQNFPCALTLVTVDKIGWDVNLDRFVLPGRVITKPEVSSSEDVILSSVAQHYIAGIKTQGELADWRVHVAEPCYGNSRLELGLYCAFLPPILRILQLHNFGVHFFGSSSLGKSTIMQVAASVWGDPARICHHWHATDNALEGLAYCHNDALLVLNEIGQADKSKLGSMIYMLGNGEGKARARINGTIRPTKTWLLGVLSTGEKTITDHISDSGQRVMAGQTVRMVDVSVETAGGRGVVENLHGFLDSGTMVKALEQAALRFHGTAVQAFIEALIIKRSESNLLAEFVEFRERYLSALPPVDRSPEVLRVISHFCNMAFAGEFAIAHGILPYPQGTAVHTTLRIVAEYEDSRGGSEGFDVLEAIRTLRQMLSEYRYRNFVRMTPHEHRFIYDYSIGPQTFWGYAVYADNDSDEILEFKIPVRVFKDTFCRGVNVDSVIGALERRGYLGKDAKQYGKNRDRCYTIPYGFLHEDRSETDGRCEEIDTPRKPRAQERKLPYDIDD
ncbi:DUF927 domain-containing protein [Acidithiobacillus caldus]